jgi:hypothetical protein
MSLKFTAKGDVGELIALFNLLNQSSGVLGVTTERLYKDKCLTSGSQTFEVMLTPAEHWQPRQYHARDLSGYVYVLRTGEESIFKIGKSKEPENRIKTFGNLLPFEVDYELLIEADNMSALEKSLHRRFASKRIRGSEFFTLNERDLRYLSALADE